MFQTYDYTSEICLPPFFSVFVVSYPGFDFQIVSLRACFGGWFPVLVM
jgi:hypothetical protein